MCQDLGNNDDQYQRCNLTSERAIIEKELKALEIIKEKEADIYGIKNSIDVYDYNVGVENEDNFENRVLTQDEYNLLKEVLL